MASGLEYLRRDYKIPQLGAERRPVIDTDKMLSALIAKIDEMDKKLDNLYLNQLHMRVDRLEASINGKNQETTLEEAKADIIEVVETDNSEDVPIEEPDVNEVLINNQ